MSKNKKNIKKFPTREQQIKKYQNVPPSQIFYNPNTINWFKKKYSEDLIKKSIYSLFPNNCQPVMTDEEWTKQRVLREFLSHYLKPEDKYKDIWINPKYFFSKEVYESILKLKEIFLQFDEDGSRKMEIDEMVVMFKTNHINVTEDDLCALFFKGKKYRKEDINKLYLDFFQFMNFALSKSSDQDFRIFMRKTKEKILKEKEKERIEEEKLKALDKKQDEVVDDLFVDEKKEPVFLPMNFNLLLDYFINKGKERKSQKKIRRAIKMMRNILTPGRYPDDDPDFRDEEDENDDSESENQEKEKKEEDEYDRQLREINTMEIMEEFDKLFKMSYVTPNSDFMEEKNNKARKKNNRRKTIASLDVKLNFNLDNKNKKDIEKEETKKQLKRLLSESNDGEKRSTRQNLRMKTSVGNYDFEKLKNNLANKINDNSYKLQLNDQEQETNNKQVNNTNEEKEKKPMFFSNLIHQEIDEPNFDDLNLYYFNKFHSVALAKKATEKKMLEYYGKQKTKTNIFRKGTKMKSVSTKKKLSILPPIKQNKTEVSEISKNIAKKSSDKVVIKDYMGKTQYNFRNDAFGFRRRSHRPKFLY